MLRCFTAVNHLSQLDHNEADLNQFLFSYFLFTSWLHSHTCQFIFFFSTVDAKKKKAVTCTQQTGFDSLQPAGSTAVSIRLVTTRAKGRMFQKFLRNSQNQEFFLRNTYLTRMVLGFYTFVYNPSIVQVSKTKRSN